MKFSEYRYERPDVKKIELQFKELIRSFNEAQTVQEQSEAMEAVNRLRNEFDTVPAGGDPSLHRYDR